MEQHAITLSRGDFEAVIFDLDGVVTDTATVHAAAWKLLFDAFLREEAKRSSGPFVPFDDHAEYLRYVDGKPRYDGVASFLAARGMELPHGDPGDPPEARTVCGLGNRKNELFNQRLAAKGPVVFQGTIRLIEQLREVGIKTAIISASENCAGILQSAGITHLFDARVDGVDSTRLKLTGKPAPDIFIEAARQLGSSPARSVVVEDALAGVEAGRQGGFALVIGVDRRGQAAALERHGAHRVVHDLSEVKVAPERPLPGDTLRAWSLRYDHFDPRQEGLREALCTTGNGYFATRGAASESDADDIHYPGTYLAGGYNRLRTEIAGRIIENEDLVNLPNWLPLTFRAAGGDWFNLHAGEILEYSQELDMKHGLLARRVEFRDRHGRVTRVQTRRLVHMETEHLAALEMTLTPVNWSGQLEIRSALDGRVVNAGVARYQNLNQRHLQPVETRALDSARIYLKTQTTQSELRIAQTARTRIQMNGAPVESIPLVVSQPDYIAHEFELKVSEGDAIQVEKVVALFTSGDLAIADCGVESQELAERADSFARLAETQALAWRHLWQRFDMGIEMADPGAVGETSMILHLHLFHLLQTTSPHTMDLDVGVPSRGWHGEAYRGHIFWDELFIFPLLNLRMPEITRALLIYRYRRLEQARRAARELGCEGAMFPWQSGSNGREETQVVHLNPKSGRWIPDHSRLQRHVNVALAYNIWQYYQVTHDLEFMQFHGAEMFLEIARFLASLARHNPVEDCYEIKGVMGPDEYHDGYPGRAEPGLDNNAYTNVMAAWTLTRALEVLELLPANRRKELCGWLRLQPEEFDLWDRISRGLKVPFHEDGIISQFEGYEQLKEFPWNEYQKKYGDIQRLDRVLEAEGDSVNAYKASKQADVLMLFYLFSGRELEQLLNRLGCPFPPEMIQRTIQYYLARTSHGSTLSRVVHSWVLARSDRPASWKLFKTALESDLKDIQGGTTPEGIHIGAMAGTVDLVQRCYTGLEMREDALWFDPRLPQEVTRLRMEIRYRGQSLHLELTSGHLKISALRCPERPIKIGFQGTLHHLHEGETKTFSLSPE